MEVSQLAKGKYLAEKVRDREVFNRGSSIFFLKYMLVLKGLKSL